MNYATLHLCIISWYDTENVPVTEIENKDQMNEEEFIVGNVVEVHASRYIHTVLFHIIGDSALNC